MGRGAKELALDGLLDPIARAPLACPPEPSFPLLQPISPREESLQHFRKAEKQFTSKKINNIKIKPENSSYRERHINMLFTFMIRRLKKKKKGINISSSDDVISNEKYTETAANNCLTEKKNALIIYFIKQGIPNESKLLLVLNFVVTLPDEFNDALAKFLRADPEDVNLDGIISPPFPVPAFAAAGCGCTGRCHHPHGCLAGLGNLLERLCPWSSSSAPPSPLLGCQIGRSEPPSHLQLSPNLYSQWSERRKHCRNVLHFP